MRYALSRGKGVFFLSEILPLFLRQSDHKYNRFKLFGQDCCLIESVYTVPILFFDEIEKSRLVGVTQSNAKE